MNGSLRMFKAVFWKQFRESQGVLILATIGALISALTPVYYRWGAQSAHAAMQPLQEFTPIMMLLGFIVAALFFLPVFAVESERKTLSLLATKPISHERITLWMMLSHAILALLVVGFTIVIFFITSYPIFSLHPSLINNISYVKLFFYYSGTALPILYGVGCYFLLISSITNNRIRCFGFGILSLFLIVVFGTVLSEILQPKMTMDIVQTEHGFFALIGMLLLHGYRVIPILLILVGCAILLPPTLLIIRWRMIHSACAWPRYASMMGIGFTIFGLLLLINLSDRNLTTVGMQTNSIGPETRNFAYQLCGNRYVEKFSQNADLVVRVVRGKYVVSLEGIRGYIDLKKDIEPVHFVIEEVGESPNPPTLYNQSVLDCLSIDRLDIPTIDPKNKMFYTIDDWRVLVAGQSGIFSGTIQYNRNRVNVPLNSEWVFLKHFSLGDSIQLTPIKKCVFHFVSSKGKETQTVDCVQPGLFSLNDFQNLYFPLISEFKQRESMKTNVSLKECSLDSNIRGSYSAILNVYKGISPKSDSDHFEANRLFQMDYEPDRFEHFWPVISCFDFSNPEILTVYCGTPHENTYPLGQVSPDYFGTYPDSSKFAVDGNRLLHIISNYDHDLMVFFDISDPEHMREIARKTYLRWTQWGNWPVAPPLTRYSKFRLDNGKLLIQSAWGVYLYEMQENFSLRKIARKCNWRKVSSIQDAQIADDRLAIGWDNDTVAQFAIGSLPNDKPIPTSPKETYIKGGWQFYVPGESNGQ